DQHILFAAALLHDVEKRSTTSTEIIDGVERIVSPKHAKKGELTVRTFLYQELDTPFEIREQIARLVRLHGLPLWAIEKEDPRKAVIEASLLVNTRLLALLTRADVLGRICDDQQELLLRVDLFVELCQEHGCFGKPYEFKSDYGRFLYLNKPDTAPDYKPYEDHECCVYVMCALPGTGKDTYVKKHLDMPVLSLDDIRRANKIDPNDKKAQGWVIQEGKEQAKVHLRKKTSFVFNATNLTVDRRSKWISLFLEYRARVKIIYLEVPYKRLLSQNHNRAQKVPENVVRRMIRSLEIPVPREAHEVEYVVEEINHTDLQAGRRFSKRG
ncbi:MAG: AAA family ATPase, partial [Bacteroidota bacterium]